MIITVVCDVLGEENNGTTITALNMIRSLKERGHEVRVVCPDEERQPLPGYYIVPTFNLGPINGYVAKNGVRLAKADRTILTEAIRDADVVHIMLPYSLGAGAAKVARKLGKPITGGCHALAENFTAHVFLMHCGLANLLLYKIYYRVLYRHCVYVHYPSQMLCALFESVTRPMPHRVISNGVRRDFSVRPCEKPPKYGGRFVILFTGRYSKEKAHKVLIDGVGLSRHRDEIQLVFAGSGPLEGKLKKYALKRLPVQPVFGFFPRGEMAQVVGCADLYVHPARFEAEGIACLEAMRGGKVIISSDSPKSATRFFALTNESLFSSGDAKSLAEKIDWWIEHPVKRAEYSELYARYAANYDFDDCMDRMEEMFYEAAGKSRLLRENDGRFRRHAYRNAGN